MIRARVISADDPVDLEFTFQRMGMPTVASELLLAKLPTFQILLTGVTEVEGRFFRSIVEATVASGREDYPFWVAGDERTRPGCALLTGRRDHFERLLTAARADPALAAMVLALERALDVRAPAPLKLGARTFDFGERTYVMGIVNVTPDSFSDGGRHFSTERAVAHGLALVEAGADILDIGGETTRPGSLPLPEKEELARVLPVVEKLAARTSVPLSVDTQKSSVAREVLQAGAVLINDISGFTFDAEMPHVVAEAGAACCLMHIQGTPLTMQRAPYYEDVVEEVLDFLDAGVRRAVAAGVPRERIIVDPGIGFGKTPGHNLYLLRRLRELRVLGLPVLVGTSRKSFLALLCGGRPTSERLAGTLGSVAAVTAVGAADFVRVHDVEETRDAVAVADAIREATEGGALYASNRVRVP